MFWTNKTSYFHDTIVGKPIKFDYSISPEGKLYYFHVLNSFFFNVILFLMANTNLHFSVHWLMYKIMYCVLIIFNLIMLLYNILEDHNLYITWWPIRVSNILNRSSDIHSYLSPYQLIIKLITYLNKNLISFILFYLTISQLRLLFW